MRNPSLKVGVAGLGTVGAALVSQIGHQRDALSARCGRAIEVIAVCARSRAKDRGVDHRKMKWFSDPLALAREPDIDVFVELIGGSGDPAKGAIEAALASGKSVVTANKALLARHGVKLAAIADQLGRRAVAGGAVAIASVLKVPADDAAVAAVRAKDKEFAGEVAVSAWNGLALARLVAPDGATLHRDLIAVLSAFGNMPLPRLWLN